MNFRLVRFFIMLFVILDVAGPLTNCSGNNGPRWTYVVDSSKKDDIVLSVRDEFYFLSLEGEVLTEEEISEVIPSEKFEKIIGWTDGNQRNFLTALSFPITIPEDSSRIYDSISEDGTVTNKSCRYVLYAIVKE